MANPFVHVELNTTDLDNRLSIIVDPTGATLGLWKSKARDDTWKRAGARARRRAAPRAVQSLHWTWRGSAPRLSSCTPCFALCAAARV
jgi:hypothetical protein